MIRQERVQKTFCTTREAAQILGISLRTAQLWSENGLLEAWKTKGGHRRISRQSVERLLFNPVGNQAAPTADQALSQSGRADKPLSILVVEDEAALRRVYELTLSRWPMKPTVKTAGDGYEALIRLGHDKPDFLITDLRMPAMDGFRMLDTLRSVPELQGMAIAVVTGLDPAEIEEQGGIPDGIPVYPKPIPFDKLLEFAESIVTRRSVVL